MNLFKGLIKCSSCSRNYNFKNDNGIPIYLCSTYKNYGSKFCKRNIVHEKDLISIVSLHLKISDLTAEIIRQHISKIEVNGDLIIIYYLDNTISEWCNDKLKF